MKNTFVIFLTIVLLFFISCTSKKTKMEGMSDSMNVAGVENVAGVASDMSGVNKSEVRNFSQEGISLTEIFPIKFIEEKYNLNSMNNIYAFSKLHLLGFSNSVESGKAHNIAFVREENFEGVGECKYFFYIQNLRTDKIVFEFSQTEEELPLGKRSVKDFVNENSEKIMQAILKYGIVFAISEFLPFPYKNGNHFLEVNVDVKDTGKLLHEMFKIADYTLTAVNEVGKQKTIHLQKDVAVEDVFVCGYVKSPFENRLAIIVAEKKYGFEGYDLHYSIVGADFSFE